MNEQSYFHWDLFRPQLHSSSFSMGASFLDIREEAVRKMSKKTNSFSLEQTCALCVLEIRKEKSRDAARSRRGKENYEFYELAKLLPLPSAITSQLDKASIIRLSISYLKLRDFCGHGDPPWIRESLATNKSLKGRQRRNEISLSPEMFEVHLGAYILQSLDGFAFVLSNDGRFLYISETVSIYLGLSQVDMAGSNIFDYVHGNDHQELADQLGITLASLAAATSAPSPPTNDSPSARAVTTTINDILPVMSPSTDKTSVRHLCIRMKSTLTKRGVHTRSSGYRVVQIIGAFRSQLSYNLDSKCSGPLLGLAGVALALPPPTITELRLEADTFIMRLTAHFKVIYCESIISTLTDWRTDDISGKDLYIFCHPGDVQQLNKLHKDLLMKGQVMSSCIRFLNKLGGYIWVQLCCTSLYCTKTSQDQTVLAIFQTVSSVEHRGVAMDTIQLLHHERHSVATDLPKDRDFLTHEKVLDRSSDDKTSESLEVTKNDPNDTLNAFIVVVDNDLLQDDKGHDNKPVKQDGKLSRRKADFHRKRRRKSSGSSSMSDSFDRRSSSCVLDKDCTTASLESSDTVTSNMSVEPCGIQDSLGNGNIDTATLHTLQDLSLKIKADKNVNSIKGISHETNDISKHNDISSNSVHELERAMSKHLPTSSEISCSLNNIDGVSMSTLQQTMLNWTESPLTNMQAFTVGHVCTQRESVIRSSLSRRKHCSRRDSAAVSVVIPPTSDIRISKEHLYVPHISIHSKHQFATHEEIVSLNSYFDVAPPPSVSSPNELMSPVQDNDCISREYLGIHSGYRFPMSNCSGKYHTSVDNEINSNLSKSAYVQVPNYQYHRQEFGNLHNLMMQPTAALNESRTSSNGSLWNGFSFPT